MSKMITFLKEQMDLKCCTSAKQILKMLKDFKTGKESDEAFKNLKFIEYGTDREVSWFEFRKDLALKDQNGSLKQAGFEYDTIKDLYELVMEDIASDKNEAKSKIKETKTLEAAKEGNTAYLDALLGQTERKEDAHLFETVTVVEPNQADKDFYKPFIMAGEAVLFQAAPGDKPKMIMQKERTHELDFRNELGIAGGDLTKQMTGFKEQYRAYMGIFKAILASISREDIIDASEEDIALIEDAIMHGRELLHKEYAMIPASFRHFVDVTLNFKRVDEVWKFERLGMKPAKDLSSFEFDYFLDFFAKNFTKMTRGCLKAVPKLKSFSNTYSDYALCTYELPDEEVWKTAKLPESWKKFFSGKASGRLLERVFFFIGAIQDADNQAQQMLLISDNGGTGKGELIRLLQELLPEGMMKNLSNTAIANPKFTVTAHRLYEAHVLFNTEYDGKVINTEFVKQITGGDTIECEIKGGQSISWDTKGMKMIFTSNRTCYMTEHAIRRRIIPVTFKKNFKGTGMDPAFRAELIRDGKDFLNFCFRIYKTSKFRNVDGSYKVMNPEQEKAFLENGEAFDEAETYETALMKAFSKDPELGDKFKSGDWSETHFNDDFEDLFNDLFEFAEGEKMTSDDFKNIILDYIFGSQNNDARVKYENSFDFRQSEASKTGYAWNDMRMNRNKQFIAFLENTLGVKYNKPAKIDGKTVRCVMNIKLNSDMKSMNNKEEEKIDDDFIDKLEI